ncbi:uncharacterized protein LOC5506965 isoform X5 [Nematostella vectensis]|uniref:uncharacterized protein LOC5506965 isoform X5 n=1 Tax=Nematostella vectensis TaxID=45351 RepID=UPI00207765B6|nr:uncharacterized protein LOC5506965 isoform X5 [Nematostella vectensis]
MSRKTGPRSGVNLQAEKRRKVEESDDDLDLFSFDNQIPLTFSVPTSQTAISIDDSDDSDVDQGWERTNEAENDVVDLANSSEDDELDQALAVDGADDSGNLDERQESHGSRRSPSPPPPPLQADLIKLHVQMQRSTREFDALKQVFTASPVPIRNPSIILLNEESACSSVDREIHLKIRTASGIKRFSLKAIEKFESVIEELAAQEGVDKKNILLSLRDQNINPDDTPLRVGATVADIIECVLLKSQIPEEDENAMTIRVHSGSAATSKDFKVIKVWYSTFFCSFTIHTGLHGYQGMVFYLLLLFYHPFRTTRLSRYGILPSFALLQFTQDYMVIKVWYSTFFCSFTIHTGPHGYQGMVFYLLLLFYHPHRTSRLSRYGILPSFALLPSTQDYMVIKVWYSTFFCSFTIHTGLQGYQGMVFYLLLLFYNSHRTTWLSRYGILPSFALSPSTQDCTVIKVWYSTFFCSFTIHTGLQGYQGMVFYLLLLFYHPHRTTRLSRYGILPSFALLPSTQDFKVIKVWYSTFFCSFTIHTGLQGYQGMVFYLLLLFYHPHRTTRLSRYGILPSFALLPFTQDYTVIKVWYSTFFCSFTIHTGLHGYQGMVLYILLLFYHPHRTSRLSRYGILPPFALLPFTQDYTVIKVWYSTFFCSKDIKISRYGILPFLPFYHPHRTTWLSRYGILPSFALLPYTQDYTVIKVWYSTFFALLPSTQDYMVIKIWYLPSSALLPSTQDYTVIKVWYSTFFCSFTIHTGLQRYQGLHGYQGMVF